VLRGTTKSAPSEEKNNNKKNSKSSKESSTSAKAGFIFPVDSIRKYLRKGKYGDTCIGGTAPVYVAAVLEYLCAEILKLPMITRTRFISSPCILHLLSRIRLKWLEYNILTNVVIASRGVLPNIDIVALPKKDRKVKGNDYANTSKWYSSRFTPISESPRRQCPS